MKKLLFFVLLLCVSTLSFAQKDVTKFLGIPVDGTKSEMIRKLKEKGFTSNSDQPDILEGEFNGEDVTLHIVTNNNKVYRIMICDKTNRDETEIRIRYNWLCNQLENSERYHCPDFSQTIADNEKIAYEMLVNNKRYEAGFYQKSDAYMEKLIEIRQQVAEQFQSKYTAEQLGSPSPDIVEEFQKEILNRIEPWTGEEYTAKTSMKSVWFMISNYYGKYYITMYYDNCYNEANGEDL